MNKHIAAFALIATSLFAAPAYAAQCGGDFNTFLSQMGREAQAKGVSAAVVREALSGVTIDQEVLAFDKRQRYTFKRSFEDYARTRVIPARIKRATALMQKHAQLLSRIERQFGVPKELIMAIWTLETDNGGGDMGKRSVVRTLATLAHDCRRTELFQGELIAALMIVNRGDLPLYRELGPENGNGYQEVQQALDGKKASMVRVNDRGEVIVSVSVPVQRFRAVHGALMLSTQGDDIDQMVTAERLAILKVGASGSPPRPSPPTRRSCRAAREQCRGQCGYLRRRAGADKELEPAPQGGGSSRAIRRGGSGPFAPACLSAGSGVGVPGSTGEGGPAGRGANANAD